MSEFLVNVLLERLAGVGNLVVGIKKEIADLTSNLEAIRPVLNDAEQRAMTDVTVGRWRYELIEVFGDMDDLLDEWITRMQKQQLDKRDKQGGKALATAKKKVSFPFPSSCLCSGQVNKLLYRHRFANRIKMLNERLAMINEAKLRFNFQTTTRAVAELPQRQKTSSLPNVKTFGRDNEKNLIVSKLLSESSEGNQIPLIIPIVGMGGMGKTSLAKMVYNDEKIKSHFEKRIWVCVSDPFEEIKIAKAIVEGLGIYNTSNELEHLLKQINDSIDGKKFLLVLDDVWSPKLSQWEELIKPLRNGATGSRVLVTTRKEEVATLMEATTHVISLKELGVPFCLSLFYYSAGVDENNVSREFSDVGLEIVKKCNGLPLAAKTLGSLMRYKKTIDEWRAILETETWQLEEIEAEVFQPLLVSYHDLAPVVKQCLLYCVTFPKEYIFDTDNLIELWMAQGYLNGNENKNEIEGQQYVAELVSRYFLQGDMIRKYEKTSCQMHDIVHDCLQYLTKNEYMILGLAYERSELRDDRLRHLTVLNASKSDCLNYLSNCKNLRTFAAFDSSIELFGPELIMQVKSLRTLNLCKNGIRAVSGKIGELIHLRYLDLSDNTDLTELPDTLSNLCNLQTLRLANCFCLKTKVDLGRLINLRHLHVDGCEGLKLMGIGRLPNLQTLDTFYVHSAGDVEDCEGNKLEDLTNLNQLQGRLTIQHVQHGNSAEEAIMLKKAHLRHLVLEFRNNYPEQVCTPEKDREILEVLQPHEALESLLINGYSGSTLSTDWFSSLHSLKRLTLESCCDCEFFPTLGRLASLESLYMGSFYVIKVGVEFLGIHESEMQPSLTIISFPKLRQLSIDHMLFWEEWEGVDAWREGEDSENIRIMPCLSSLEISNCKYLEALPDFLWKTPLQKLHITGSSVLENLYREGLGEERAKISHIPTITLGNRATTDEGE